MLTRSFFDTNSCFFVKFVMKLSQRSTEIDVKKSMDSVSIPCFINANLSTIGIDDSIPIHKNSGN